MNVKDFNAALEGDRILYATANLSGDEVRVEITQVFGDGAVLARAEDEREYVVLTRDLSDLGVER